MAATVAAGARVVTAAARAGGGRGGSARAHSFITSISRRFPGEEADAISPRQPAPPASQLPPSVVTARERDREGDRGGGPHYFG